jgi:hypothetical protein
MFRGMQYLTLYLLMVQLKTSRYGILQHEAIALMDAALPKLASSRIGGGGSAHLNVARKSMSTFLSSSSSWAVASLEQRVAKLMNVSMTQLEPLQVIDDLNNDTK